ncbi:MAG: FCD domain-containing protein [Dongiaceae bacterium]
MSKAEQAYALLRRDLLDARLAPHHALTIASLKQRYDLGWTPLREALSRLERERLVTFAPNRGYRVAGVSGAELLDLQKARRAIEPALLRESIERGDQAWEQRVVAAHHALKRARPLRLRMAEAELSRWEASHEAFHRALVGGGESPWLLRFFDQVHDQLHRHHRILVLAGAMRPDGNGGDAARQRILSHASSLAHHARLMEAALARDGATALRLLDEHIGFTLGAYEALNPEEG